MRMGLKSVAGTSAILAPWEERLIAGLVFTVTLCTLLPPGLFLEDFSDHASVVMQGSIWFQLEWGSIFAVSAFVVARHRALILSNLRATNPFLLAILIYSATTALWSPAQFVTTRKVTQFAGLVVISLATRLDCKPWPYFIRIMVGAITTVELISAVVAIVNPSIGIDAQFGYAWRGVSTHKNELGALSAVGVLLWTTLWRAHAVSPRMFWPGFLLSLLCVVMSKSSTAFITMILGLLSFWMLHKQHIGSPLWLWRLIVCACMVLLTLTHLFFILEGRVPNQDEILGPVAGLFGKDADLTGRSYIWELVYLEIKKHWLFGLGYGAFWLGPGSASQPVLDAMGWFPFEAHNGYIDLLNELGIVGLILFTGLLSSDILSMMRLAQFDRIGAALFGTLLVMNLLTNFSETALFRGVQFQFLILILASGWVNSVLNQRLRT